MIGLGVSPDCMANMSMAQLTGMINEAARRQGGKKNDKPMSIETFERLKEKAAEMDAARARMRADNANG